MKIEINAEQFCKEFGKRNRGNNFTISGLYALYEYLNETYGDDYVLDVIDICCTYTEYESYDEYRKDYSGVTEDDLSDNIICKNFDGGKIIIINW